MVRIFINDFLTKIGCADVLCVTVGTVVRANDVLDLFSVTKIGTQIRANVTLTIIIANLWFSILVCAVVWAYRFVAVIITNFGLNSFVHAIVRTFLFFPFVIANQFHIFFFFADFDNFVNRTNCYTFLSWV